MIQIGYEESVPSDLWEGERRWNLVQAKRNNVQEMGERMALFRDNIFVTGGTQSCDKREKNGFSQSPSWKPLIHSLKDRKNSFFSKAKIGLTPETTLLCLGPHKGLFSHFPVLVHSVSEKGCQFSQFHDTGTQE
jgi:hypothetical protein